jgi:hypothetical protein
VVGIDDLVGPGEREPVARQAAGVYVEADSLARQRFSIMASTRLAAYL